MGQWGPKKWLHFSGNCFSALPRNSLTICTKHFAQETLHSAFFMTKYFIISSTKVTIFWDTIQRSFLHRSKCFGVSRCLYLQSWSPSRVWHKVGTYSVEREEQEFWALAAESTGYNQFLMLTLHNFPEDWGGMFLRNIDNDLSGYIASRSRSHWRDSLKSQTRFISIIILRFVSLSETTKQNGGASVWIVLIC
jgi:hypothetical protein